LKQTQCSQIGKEARMAHAAEGSMLIHYVVVVVIATYMLL
jgi:hypothetical protein